MTEQERIDDINTLDEFNDTEVQKDDSDNPNAFKAIEYYLILHYTNGELYYLDSSEEMNFETCCDKMVDTEKARIYLFK